MWATFSGSCKAIYYQVLRLITGQHGAAAAARYAPVRLCGCGQIFDSSPVDFLATLGVRFLAPPGSPRWRAAAAHAASAALTAVCAANFERQRAEMWEALEGAGAGMVPGAPTLLLFSDDDSLAEASVVEAFAKRLESRGAAGSVRTRRWQSSEHVGHLRVHPEEYEAAVAALLADAREAWRRSRGGGSDGGEEPPLGRTIHSRL